MKKHEIPVNKGVGHVIRINVSLTPTLVDEAKKLFTAGGWQGWSDYLSCKIRRDAGLDPQDRLAREQRERIGESTHQHQFAS